MTKRTWILASAGALSVGAFLAQQYSLGRYDLNLPIPEWLWIQLAVGWSFLLAGLASDSHRPDSAIGKWMVTLGLVWIGRLVLTPPLIQWEAIGAGIAFYGLLFVILYTFPSGRLRGWERWAVPAYLALVALVSYLYVALTDYYGWVVDHPTCCPSHLLLIEDNRELRNRIASLAAVAASVLFLVIVVVFFVRWRGATRVRRRGIQPLVLVLVPLLVLLVLIPGINAVADGLTSIPFPDQASSRLALYLQNGALLVVPLIILSELLGTKLSQARVADMVRELSSSISTPDELNPSLRRTLGDPGAELAFRRSTTGGLVDVEGRVLTAESLVGKAVTDLDELVVIVHDGAVDPRLAEAAGMAASLVIANARLQAELKAQLIEVRESRRRLVAATDDARRKVERDLHDGAQQRLVALAGSLVRAQQRGGNADPDLMRLLADAAREADLAIDDLRNLARGVHPAILTQTGLGPAIATLSDLSGIPINARIVPQRFDEVVEACAYFVVSEGVANAHKHSGADHVEVGVESKDDQLSISIEDNGVGGADPEGSGLRGLSDRVAALGGTLTIESTPGSGTRILATIPLPNSEPTP